MLWVCLLYTSTGAKLYYDEYRSKHGDVSVSKYYRSKIFPPKAYMKRTYPVLTKKMHNIANQHPSADPPRRQEYPPRAAETKLVAGAEGARSRRADSTAYFTAKTVPTKPKTAPKRRPPGTEWHGRSQPTTPELSHTLTSNPPQPYIHAPAPHPPHHAYQHHQEVQIVPPPPLPPHQQHQNTPNAPKQEDFADQPYREVIHMITGGVQH